MIEQLIERLIAALNENTAALTGRVQTNLPLATEIPATPIPPDVKAAVEDLAKVSKPRKPKTDTPAPAETPPPAPEPAKVVELTVEDFQKVGHAIIDARHAKKLEPANAPIKVLAADYGVKKISEVAGTEKAAEVMAKLQAILKECAA